MQTFNDLLTRIVMNLDVYKYVQTYLVPAIIRMVGVLLLPLGLKPVVAGQYLSISGRREPLLIEIAWNCIGWQSLLFFLLTGWVGLQGDKYSLFSKIHCWLIGFLGTFIINILRITLVVLTAFYLGNTAASLVHEYLANIAVIGWLFFFWWFAYKFVLEEI